MHGADIGWGDGAPPAPRLRVLDLFSGLRGWSQAFEERGHETFCIEWGRQFRADAYLDIGNVAGVLDALPWRPDLVLASPPCTAFTTMTMGRNWTHADLWGAFPPGLVLPDACHNGNPDHIAAPRGSYTGTQGMESAAAAKVPYALSALVADAMERWEPGEPALRLLDRAV